MRLADLHPVLQGSLDDGWLHFDCPVCGNKHQVAIHVSRAPFHHRAARPGDHPSHDGTVKVWQASGEFPNSLTLQPSINIVVGIKDEHENIIGWKTDCWHGFVTTGTIT